MNIPVKSSNSARKYRYTDIHVQLLIIFCYSELAQGGDKIVLPDEKAESGEFLLNILDQNGERIIAIRLYNSNVVPVIKI